ncbi:unnamed protein product [Heterosigma akashiwo]
MAGYYRAMIPNFSTIASPLHSLTRLSSPDHVVWNEACEESFNKLKHILTSQPVLQFPNWTKDFYLECDASRTGIGAVLMQEVGDGMKAPIAYTSRLTSSAEKNYSVYDLELLSVVHACQRFRQYIYGRHIKIFSDHIALRSLLSLKRPSGRLARWLMILSELDYSIHYKRGVDNKVADSLSRLKTEGMDPSEPTSVEPSSDSKQSLAALSTVLQNYVTAGNDFVDDDDDDDREDVNGNDEEDVEFLNRCTGDPIYVDEKGSLAVIETPIVNEEISVEEMLQAQANDPFCSKCIGYLKNATLPEDIKEANFITAHARVMGLHVVKQGEAPSLLIHHWDTVGEFRRRIRRVQIVVPENEEMRNNILRWAHGAGTTGHMGAQKAFSVLRSGFWWRNMYASLVNYIRLCDRCQRLKNPVARLRVRARPCRRPMPRGVMDVLHLDGCVIAGTTVIVFVCAFSKYPEVYISPRKNMTGRMLGEAFLSKVVARYGLPRTVISDQVAFQKYGEFPELLRLLGVTQKWSIAHRPHSNGVVESKTKVLKSLIRSVAAENPARWKSMMPFCLLIYRCSFHRSIGTSPFYLMHGRLPNLPGRFSRTVDSLLQDVEVENPSAYAMNLAHRMQEAYRVATYNLNKNRNLLQHEALLPEFFAVGDRVLLYTPKVKVSTDIFKDTWCGDYQITRQISKVIMEIQRVDNPQEIKKVHVNRLKKKL